MIKTIILRKIFKSLFFISMLITSSISFASANQILPTYSFKFIPNQSITMQDGTKLSASYWKPKANTHHEKFPIVIEILPYRKDDSGYTTAYSRYAYLARRGIACIRVDIRGTGSSEGIVPDREYSDQELADIPIIIKQVAELPWSNGNIGMQGISWSAFNAIMAAMQKPTELKSILIAHGSDDLYANDIHNIDGALHIDIFTVEIDTDNILPRSPTYLLDKKYFADRFNQKPWIFTYLEHQRDGKFWETDRSLQTHFAAINIPVFAFASLLDGYKDYAIHMLDNVKTPLKVNIGPQIHAWPDGDPGPYYEWQQLAARWWQQTLNGKEYGIWQEPKVTLFRRGYVTPNINLQDTPGEYSAENWPISSISSVNFILKKDKQLAYEKSTPAIDSLVYKPSVGKGALNWWGETTPDMRTADEGTLIYDSTSLTKEINVIGNPTISLKVAANAALADWVVRLEDVSPDGRVSFITGALRNGALRDSRTHPKPIIKGQFFRLTFPLHFTTWKFLPGHKLRLSISNAQFPMIWATPYKMTTKLMVSDGSSTFSLPIAPTGTAPPVLPKLEPSELTPNAIDLKSTPLTQFKITQDKHGNTFATSHEGYQAMINGTSYQDRYQVTYRVNDNNPADASFIGEGEDTVKVAKTQRIIKVKTTTRIDSDIKYFHVSVVHSVFENGKLLATKQWQENILRDFQ